MSTERANKHARKALGRGINALLGGRQAPPASTAPTAPAGKSAVRQVPVEQIQPNPYQPRRSFHPDRLNELAASIQSNGVVQPVLLRPGPGGKFEIVAGERRWRAARIAGLTSVPALVEDISDERLLEVALVENIQREDLNPLEMAHAFEQLMRDFSLTHEGIAQRTGKDRATITNFLRLLKLPAEIQLLIVEEKISMGHAKALLGLGPAAQKALALRIVAQALSVRAAERLAQKPAQKTSAAIPAPRDPNIRAAIQEMERTLGTKVRILEAAGGRGRIQIEYYSAEDLERLYSLLVRK